MDSRDQKLYLFLIGACDSMRLGCAFWGPGIRDSYIIHYVISGSGFFECAGKKHHITAGQSFIIYPSTLIDYYPDKNDPWEYIWVDFAGLEAAKLIGFCGFSEKNPVSPEAGDDLLDLFKDIVANSLETTPADVCRNIARLRNILAYYMELYPAQNTDYAAETMQAKLVEYIENNCTRKEFSIDSAAEHFNISRISLFRYFKSELGISPNKYITQIKIERACQLLKFEDISIKDISYSLGYSDQLYFSRVFRRITGVSPSDYRDSEKNDTARSS